MPLSYKQLELDLWGDLKTALTEPESADMELLWQGLEEAIAYSDTNGQLLVAGDAKPCVRACAIAQIVEVYVKRAKSILDRLKLNLALLVWVRWYR